MPRAKEINLIINAFVNVHIYGKYCGNQCRFYDHIGRLTPRCLLFDEKLKKNKGYWVRCSECNTFKARKDKK